MSTRNASKVTATDVRERVPLTFLVGPPRAGPHLLDTAISAHPQLYFIRRRIAPLRALTAGPAGDDPETPRSRQELQSIALADYRQTVREHGVHGIVDASFTSVEIPELQALFPAAQFLFVTRSPLVVIAHLYFQRVRRDLSRWADYQTPLLHHLGSLRQWIPQLRQQCMVCRCEDVASDNIETWRRLFAFLEVPMPSEPVPPEAVAADERAMFQSAARIPQVWQLMHDCLQRISYQDLEAFGYSWNDLVHQLRQAFPHPPGPTQAYTWEEIMSGQWRQQSLLRRWRVGLRNLRTSAPS